ncbi:hypothetical protein SPRG_14824 [Saprolegnia parasitica CBS 223.65]|uniref:Uncharacterized protein n=1 Tax=Saprolegnia parasitica (strain CBS 223.65) TaxID=695850 RepID=A0A067C027_SAPPC|nr:hypothetical protein SPRG_14824 [Saprolegnia parasitica CBS 223.65]KDO19916.1 hypothetical protein SPRG_14824 [Saprolegnia parasitica CBS 223.65]|eukprot:XP_012209356.1 hypothetical protein SPRG_14824 [Saprolegnia parasitica CBS 223.65]
MNQGHDDDATADARWHNRLGALLSASGKYAKAVAHFEAALRLDPTYAAAHYNLGNALVFTRRQANDDDEAAHTTQSAVDHFRLAIAHQPTFADAHVNLAAQLYALGDCDAALVHARTAIELDPTNTHGYYNLNTIYRALGQQCTAIELCWARVQALVGAFIERPTTEPVHVPPPPSTVSIACVKWGTKYGSDYVNKLYSGIQRHLATPFRFYCLTDDAAGLRPEIIVHPLQPGFVGWWNKAQLFAPDFPATGSTRPLRALLSQVVGRVVYIDLDTVLVGDITALCSYAGPFGVLGTDDMRNERRRGGINSSVMIWSAGSYAHVFTLLAAHATAVHQCIYKFDHWLEMILHERHYDELQLLYPGHIVEYMQACQATCPGAARLVCFPLEPKPHTAPAPWIQAHWV